MLRTLITVLIVFLCGACQGVAKPTWHAEPGLQDAAQDAADAWCVASDGAYCPVVDDPNGAELRWSRPGEKTAQDNHRCGTYRYKGEPEAKIWHEIAIASDASTATWDDGVPVCRFWLDDGTQASEYASLVAAVAHELGHAGGAPDVHGDARLGLLMGRTCAFFYQRPATSNC